jgi:hypothetical protein
MERGMGDTTRLWYRGRAHIPKADEILAMTRACKGEEAIAASHLQIVLEGIVPLGAAIRRTEQVMCGPQQASGAWQ